jgi:hypothetical protein
MNERTSIFETDPLDISGFKPRTNGPSGPAPAEIDSISQGKFQSREANPPSARRLPMVYRTGRNVTFSVKTAPATVDAFYALATKMGWKANETFEQAILALQEKLG